MLPKLKDVTQTLSPSDWPERDVEEALELATRATEILTKVDVRERNVKETILVTDGKVRLKHHPVRDIKVAGMSTSGTDEAEGLIKLEQYQPNTYEITYRVGFQKEWLPAIIFSIITNLARYQLTGQVMYREEALTELVVVRQQRDKAIANRPT